jgi:two-component system, NarL family, response regulator DevR
MISGGGEAEGTTVRQPLKVFIVDDSRVVRERLVAMLSDLDGIEIIGQAEDAFSALEAIPVLKPDVVILDIYMPGSATGIYVLERIRRERNAPTIIMLTNYAYEQYRQRCLESGAAFFFDKSTEFERVRDVLTALYLGTIFSTCD